MAENAVKSKCYHISNYVRPNRSNDSEKYRFWWTADFGITIMDGRSDWFILNDDQTPSVSLIETKSGEADWAYFFKKGSPKYEARISVDAELYDDDTRKVKREVRLLHIALTFPCEGKTKKLEYVFDLREGEDDAKTEETKRIYLDKKWGILKDAINLDETEEFRGKLREVKEDKSTVKPSSSVQMAIVPCTYQST